MDTPPPPPLATGSDDKIWIILCHLSLIIGVGFILPLIVYFVKKQDSPLTAEHAREALNFHISVYLYAFVSFLLCFIFIGVPLLFILGIGSVICSIVACIKASDGQFYRYPLTLRFV
ncbi:MAG: DUF4870 domain-containing protein [Chthoniobacterales bacterium]